MSKFITAATIAAAVLVCASGKLANASMAWVTVGDPGNHGEWSGASYGGAGGDRFCGAVDCTYRIGQYEVTNNQYVEFLNAVATVGDPHGLYNTNMGGGWSNIGGIARTGSGTGADPWVYVARRGRGNHPVLYVSWFDTLRFSNWMHNGKGSGNTEDGAYDMSLGWNAVRKTGALVFLPTEDEWYKAAYYKGGGTDAGYWDYSTQSDTVPTAEAPPGTDLVNGSANYYRDGYVDPVYLTTPVGAYDAGASASAYGTFDQGGNVQEWTETLTGSMHRAIRGSTFGGTEVYLHAASRLMDYPTGEHGAVGFRVAAVPEPATIALLAFGAMGVLGRRRG